jgi:hypothetical protein
MHPGLRNLFNFGYTEHAYYDFLNSLNASAGTQIPFRVAETPVFLNETLREELLQAGNDIINQLLHPDYLAIAKNSIPDRFKVPGEVGKPTMLALDFAIINNHEGKNKPMLIELQGFPSLFYYQHLLAQSYKTHYPSLKNLSHLFIDEKEYLVKMKSLLLGGHSNEDTVLLELDPSNQNTYIDFLETSRQTGIDIVCLSEVLLDNGHLYRIKAGRKIPIRRIYNRIIFDELVKRPELAKSYNLTDSIDVEWVCHPNWYFMISKFSLPYLKSDNVPHTIFASDYVSDNIKLSDYVLKPLYSFSGSGVELHPTETVLKRISNPTEYILQRKVEYAPSIITPDGNAKVEIRMMYAWFEGESCPKPVITLARLSKGEMVGVKYNRDKTWVGSSVCLMTS